MSPPPYDLAVEEAVLASMFFSHQASADAIYLLEPEDFFTPRNQILFETLRSTFLDEQEVDPLIIVDRVRRAATWDDEEFGDIKSYIAELMGQGTDSGVRGKCAILLRWSNARKLHRVVAEGLEGTDEALASASAAATELLQRMQRMNYEDRPTLIGSDLSEMLVELEERSKSGKPAGLLSGIGDLDRKTGGFKPGQFVVVAARPGMGKTAWMVQIAIAVARLGLRVAFFTLEMSTEELRWRALSQLSRVPLWKFGAAALEEHDWQRITSAAAILQNCFITLDGRAEITPVEIGVECRRLASEHHGLDLIVVDYLQLMKPPREAGNRQEEISDISRSMKLLAKQMHVPVIVGSQLNRNLEYRENKRPKLADLRDSGALEQDSDVVTFLYRDEVYNPGKGNEGFAELILAKHRNGPTGKVDLHFLAEHATFYARQRPPQEEKLPEPPRAEQGQLEGGKPYKET